MQIFKPQYVASNLPLKKIYKKRITNITSYANDSNTGPRTRAEMDITNKIKESQTIFSDFIIIENVNQSLLWRKKADFNTS
jgi:hypothetical protein